MALFDSDQDLDIFVNTTDFAKTATVTPISGGDAFSLTGILNDIVLVGNEFSGDVREDSTSFTVKSSDVTSTGIVKNDTVTIDSVTYLVIDFDNNTSGLTNIVMERRIGTRRPSI